MAGLRRPDRPPRHLVRNADVGHRSARRHARDRRLRDRPYRADQSGVRCQAGGHRRSRRARPRRPQCRVRVERRRVRHVRHDDARARHALRLYRGMAHDRQAHLVRRGAVRFSRRAFPAQGRHQQAEALWWRPAVADERRIVRHRTRIRGAQRRLPVHGHRRHRQARRRDHGAASVSAATVRSASIPAVT